ncbi:MAG: type II toxin-antitoxin system RelE/ParE family toxin [Cyanobacteria bacterium CRU_2_1]|nr:type II toxin-antitoxin system RelE/ParE family toxin [Cyanobacteria bacterium RU_5_0]NJR60781.1 type II toxin-antitoxin system RelE/ParE family toxin [Cyanobacteria bacterium CRU_2_1]
MYQIEITEDAKEDFSYYKTTERKIILTEVRKQLTQAPLLATRNRKPLWEQRIASWELRVGQYRVFYDVDEATRIVAIVAVGHKVHNTLFIKGKEVTL